MNGEAVTFKPSDVHLSAPPLVNTMRRAEYEAAAAIIVRTCQVLGDCWQMITWEQAHEALAVDLDRSVEPFASLIESPFFRPDIRGLVDAGFAVAEGQGHRLTQKGLEALRPWVRESRREDAAVQ